MRVVKNPAPIETKLDLSAVRVTLYSADGASDPPNHPRVIVQIPGKPDAISADMPLSEVLDKKQIAALAGFQDTFVKALLAAEGFAQAADDLSASE